MMCLSTGDSSGKTERRSQETPFSRISTRIVNTRGNDRIEQEQEVDLVRHGELIEQYSDPHLIQYGLWRVDRAIDKQNRQI
jgi:hypothetical protein